MALSCLRSAHLAARASAGARSVLVVAARAKGCELDVHRYLIIAISGSKELEYAMINWERCSPGRHVEGVGEERLRKGYKSALSVC
jgi:hypothetical protein